MLKFLKMTNKDIVSIRIGGPAGSGVKSVGKLLQKSLQHAGFYSFGYLGYPSLIRGGYNFYQINLSQQPVDYSLSYADIFIPLNSLALEQIKKTGSKPRYIIADKTALPDDKRDLPDKSQVIKLNLTSQLKKLKITKISLNSALVGALFKFLNLPLEKLNQVIKKQFVKKGRAVIGQNLKAAALGFNSLDHKPLSLSLPTTKVKTLVMTGNTAIALGFIQGQGRFFSAYPMTPSTSILHYLASVTDNQSILVRQASTEIEAIGIAAGAAYAGVRTMVATSGGGLDLMSEFISLLGIAEIPLVIVDAQRTGPGTGLPTWQEQSDLNIARCAGHGEFPRVVMAPGDPAEAFHLIQEALNLADEYQIPVIFLTDKYLGESLFSLDKSTFDHRSKIKRGKILNLINDKHHLFPRYQFDQDGISPRPLPGNVNGIHITTSDEHDVYGNSIESDPIRIKMQTKRLSKLGSLAKNLPPAKAYGNLKAKTLVVGWGSTKKVIQAVVDRLNLAGLHLSYLYPLNHAVLKSILNPYQQIILVENNSTGQLETDLKLAGVKNIKTLLKFDGEPFFADELLEKIKLLI